MSKGSWHRPPSVSRKVRDDNWDKIDWSKKKKDDKKENEKEPEKKKE